MSPLVRWIKFNLVGAIGVVVQLSALAAFNRLMPGHYLCATAAAIEVALLHNFTWHWHLTWRDRRDRSAPLIQLFKFHVSNGIISLVGNLVLMRIFKQRMGLPLLVANALAIVGCSMLNFLVSDRCAFAESGKPGKRWGLRSRQSTKPITQHRDKRAQHHLIP